METDPFTYWRVKRDDIRVILLQRLMDLVDSAAFEAKSNDEIVKYGVEALKKFKLDDSEFSQLRNAIFEQNKLAQDDWVAKACEEIGTLNTQEVAVVSLGCGDESVFERAVAQKLSELYPEIKIEWIGIDIGDFRSETSFMKDKKLVVVDPNAEVNYKEVVNTTKPTVLIGRWSFHHLGITLAEFLNRCIGVEKIVLVEEPTTHALWSKPDYRVMRVVYDMLGNYAVSQAWTKEFMTDPSKFKVHYIFKEDLPASARLIDYPGMLPETSLVIL